MFRRKANKYKSIDNDKTESSGNKRKCEELNQIEEEYSGIVVSKNDSVFSKAAITLLLDNIASPNDIKNILQTEAKIKRDCKKDCEFCNKKCDSCEICCSDKELQMYLLHKALQKLSYISLCSENSFSGKANENKNETRKKNINRNQSVLPSDKCEYPYKAETFKKLKTKLKNLKKYYPNIYNYKGDILEQWGQDAAFNTVKTEILNFDKKSSSLFWI